MNANHFQDLVTPFQDKLYRFAWSLLRNQFEAEDAVQDVILKLWERKEKIDQIENLEAWLMRATKNKCIDMMRSKGRNNAPIEEVIHIEAKERSPDELAESGDILEKINAFMDDLSETQKAVIMLRDIEGYTYDEISEILDLSLSQVKIKLHRARKNMREKLLKANLYGTR